ncbi:hypothetical protein [Streptomyces spiramyceticus]|uniref:hypothetical protein n=1 Tax=Streptomyces spiramyceticus TaxID=299717 RepID=UPI00237A4370|nr:hypothetical protein [Streptomyces spiramyceticus]
MHKLRKAAVLVAALAGAGLLSAGTAHAGGDGHGHHKGDHFNIKQSSECKSHDLNLDVLGQVGLVNGLLGSALNGEGHPGEQKTHIGSSMGCDNSAF